MGKKNFGFSEETKKLFRIEWATQEEVIAGIKRDLMKLKKKQKIK